MSSNADDLTTQLAKSMFENHAGFGWSGVSESVREIYTRSANIVIAHLTSTGRLIPAGGMALTAEQVEDVRAAREGLRGYRNFDGNARGRVNRLIAAVDALFPATEPAEEAPNLAAVAQEPRRFNPADECQNDNHDPGCTCGAQHWMTASAPAEPAEEETKAECTLEALRDLFNGGPDTAIRTTWHDGVEYWEVPADDMRAILTSSPVVPAPTETEWQTWQEVPEGVKYYGVGDTYLDEPVVYVNRPSVVRHRVDDGERSSTPDYEVESFAPFVAAEKG